MGASLLAVAKYIVDLGRSKGLYLQGKAEWAIDSEAMRARRIIVLVKSNQLVKNIETKQL